MLPKPCTSRFKRGSRHAMNPRPCARNIHQEALRRLREVVSRGAVNMRWTLTQLHAHRSRSSVRYWMASATWPVFIGMSRPASLTRALWYTPMCRQAGRRLSFSSKLPTCPRAAAAIPQPTRERCWSRCGGVAHRRTASCRLGPTSRRRTDAGKARRGNGCPRERRGA